MSGYIIHFDNETELAHYGVRGMKWKKGKKSAKPFVGTPESRRKKQAFEKNALRKQSRKVENQLYKDLTSKKYVNKTYKIGTSDVDLYKNSKRYIAFPGTTGKNTHNKAAEKTLNNAINRAIKHNIKSKQLKKNKTTKKGKSTIEKWWTDFKKGFKAGYKQATGKNF